MDTAGGPPTFDIFRLLIVVFAFEAISSDFRRFRYPLASSPWHIYQFPLFASPFRSVLVMACIFVVVPHRFAFAPDITPFWLLQFFTWLNTSFALSVLHTTPHACAYKGDDSYISHVLTCIALQPTITQICTPLSTCGSGLWLVFCISRSHVYNIMDYKSMDKCIA